MTEAELEKRKQKLQESGLVEWSVFSELIAMDEDEEGFSKSLFETFVEQVTETTQEIDVYLKEENLDKLSSLGHYLKGSAAALGLVTISVECERIQNYGKRINFDSFSPSDYEPKTKEEKEDLEETQKKVDIKSLTEDDDQFWILAIKDALSKTREGYAKSKEVLDYYFDDCI